MIKVGDKVKELPVLKHQRNKKGFVGVVKEVIPYNPDDPIVDHGFVEVQILEKGTISLHLDVADLEHYGHYNWEKCLKILPES